MEEKFQIITWMSIASTFLFLCVFVLLPSKKSYDAKVVMLNVGQGDSFFIQASNGAQMLIDGGRDASVLSELAKVMPTGDRSIDVVIATHPDADHVAGLPLVLNRYHVGLFLTSQVTGSTKTWDTLLQALQHHRVPAYYVRHGMKMTLDPSRHKPAVFSILFPDRPTVFWETNAASVVGRLQIGNASALFTGDSPISIEQFLSRAIASEIKSDVLKLGHHGSKTSSSQEYLRTVAPRLGLISAGLDNNYGHPHKQVIDRLQSLGIPYISTQQKGTVTLTTDGATWLVK